MLLLPYERLELHSPFSPSEIAGRLESVTLRREPWFKDAPIEKHFYGVVTAGGFRLVRIIEGRNTYLPQLRGRVRPAESGSNIDVAVTLHPTAIVILIALFGWVTFVALQAGNGLTPPLLMFLAFHIGMYFFSFRPEVRATRATLQQILAAA